MSTASESTRHETRHRSRNHARGARCSGANWSALNVTAMVLGFVLFWPIGLFVLLWIVAGRDVQELPDAIRRQWSKVTDACRGPSPDGAQGATDNVVFNEYQQAQYERVREIKEEIKARTRRFRDFRADAKRRADEDEFDRFMSQGPARDGG